MAIASGFRNVLYHEKAAQLVFNAINVYIYFWEIIFARVKFKLMHFYFKYRLVMRKGSMCTMLMVKITRPLSADATGFLISMQWLKLTWFHESPFPTCYFYSLLGMSPKVAYAKFSLFFWSEFCCRTLEHIVLVHYRETQEVGIIY